MSLKLLVFRLLLLMGPAFIVVRLFLRRASEGAKQVSTSADRIKIAAAIRRLKFVVVALPVLLAIGLLVTRGEPLLPRMTGAAVNILITLWLISLIRRAKRQLR
jgi:hypothetical protein